MRSTPARRARRATLRRGGALLAALSLWAAPGAATAAEPGMIAYDLAIVRPIAALHTLIGGALFVPVAILSLPRALVGGIHQDDFQDAFVTFVGAPTVDLYRRPLGEF